MTMGCWSCFLNQDHLNAAFSHFCGEENWQKSLVLLLFLSIWQHNTMRIENKGPDDTWRDVDDHLTYEAYDAADEGVEVTAVPRHDGFLLGQQSFPRRLHHIHGDLSDENLTQEIEKERQIKKKWQSEGTMKKLGAPLQSRGDICVFLQVPL